MEVIIKEGVYFDMECAYTAMIKRLETKSDYKHKIISILGKNITSSKVARAFSGSDEVAQFTCANAIITNSWITKATLNLFLNIVHPKYPAKLFLGEKEAKRWLSTFEPDHLEPEVVENYLKETRAKLKEIQENRYDNEQKMWSDKTNLSLQH